MSPAERERRAERVAAGSWRMAMRVLLAAGGVVRCPHCATSIAFRLPKGGAGMVEILDHNFHTDFGGSTRCPGSRRRVTFALPTPSVAWTERGTRWLVRIGVEIAILRNDVRLAGFADRWSLLRALGAAPFAALLRAVVTSESYAGWWAYSALREGVTRLLSGKPHAIDQLEELVHALPADRDEPAALAQLAGRVLSHVATVRALRSTHGPTCPHRECQGGSACDGGPLGPPGCRAVGVACDCGAVAAGEKIGELCKLAAELAEKVGGRG